MKTKFFAALMFLCLGLGSATASGFQQQPQTLTHVYAADIQVVMTQKKIWFITDELAVKTLDVMMTNEEGAVVRQKQFNAKTTEWSLDVQDLPAGEYKLFVGDQPVKKFTKDGVRV